MFVRDATRPRNVLCTAKLADTPEAFRDCLCRSRPPGVFRTSQRAPGTFTAHQPRTDRSALHQVFLVQCLLASTFEESTCLVVDDVYHGKLVEIQHLASFFPAKSVRCASKVDDRDDGSRLLHMRQKNSGLTPIAPCPKPCRRLLPPAS